MIVSWCSIGRLSLMFSRSGGRVFMPSIWDRVSGLASPYFTGLRKPSRNLPISRLTAGQGRDKKAGARGPGYSVFEGEFSDGAALPALHHFLLRSEEHTSELQSLRH